MIVWLMGGPGAPSCVYMFQAMGPVDVNYGSQGEFVLRCDMPAKTHNSVTIHRLQGELEHMEREVCHAIPRPAGEHFPIAFEVLQIL